MPDSYPKRAITIFWEKGPVELSKASFGYLMGRVGPQRRFRYYTLKNHLLNRIKYDAPPNPYSTIAIRPRDIDYRISWINDTRPLARVRNEGIGRIKAGDWDSPNNRFKIDQEWRIEGLRQRFEQEMEWEETVYYKMMAEEDKQGYERSEFDSFEDYLKTRCEKYDQLYKEIKNGGYRPNHQGTNLHPGISQPVRNRLEVLVTIDRDGSIHFFEGHHRFGIARVLDIEIPAHVVCRHKQWQKLRDEIHNNGLPEGRDELRGHPDLQDVIDD